ncbi:hypothetical protein [Arsukibacterium sp.]|uniref:hypothetical protein n=1 Tax=Arsukibacterium sp. TaxID=1977258 RepID=UPI002FDB0095
MFGGLFNSKSKTTQQQTTTNNNYNIDNSDNSRNEFFDQSDRSIGGFMSGSTFGGDVTVTDGGAFAVASDSLYAMGSLGVNALDNMRVVSSDAVLSSANLASNVVQSTNDLAGLTASYMAGIAQDSLYTNSNLFKSLSADIMASSADSQNTVLDSTKYALQFADSVSRSDGQQLAISTNKNMLALVAVIGVSGAALLIWGRK